MVDSVHHITNGCAGSLTATISKSRVSVESVRVTFNPVMIIKFLIVPVALRLSSPYPKTEGEVLVIVKFPVP